MKKYYKYEANMLVMNIFAIIIFVFLCIFLVLINKFEFFEKFDLIFFIYMIFWFILHEILHGIGFCLSKNVKFKNITFGILLEKGIMYCMCKQEISKKAILIALLLPLTTIGIITLAIGLIINSSLLVLLSILNIVGAAGDIIMTMQFLKLPKEVTYIDFDNPTQYTILSNEDLKKEKYFGVKLKKKGIYNPVKMKAKEFNKVKISKVSVIIILVLFILVLISVF